MAHSTVLVAAIKAAYSTEVDIDPRLEAYEYVFVVASEILPRRERRPP